MRSRHLNKNWCASRRLHIAITSLLLATHACGANPSAPRSDGPVGPPISITVLPDSVNLVVRGTQQLVGVPVARDGRVVNLPVDWSVADRAVATISSSGLLVAVGRGTTVVTARAGELSGSARINVLDLVGSIAFTRSSFGDGLEDSDVMSAWQYRASDHEVAPIATPPAGVVGFPAWSSDGRHVVLQIGFGDNANELVPHYFSQASDLYVSTYPSADPSAWRRITADGQSRSPDWSSTGDRIVYVSGPSGSCDIYMMSPWGGSRVRLTSESSRYSSPRWSPDGTRIAVARWLAGEHSRIVILNVDGTLGPSVVQQDGDQLTPSWSPDGRRLAFTLVADRTHSEIFSVDTDGSSLTRLTNSIAGGTSSDPVWSPDGRAIAFSVRQPAMALSARPAGMFVMRADGSQPTQITHTDRVEVHWPSSWKR